MGNDAYERAKRILVGGVNSPVRSFSSVGEKPVFVSRAKGPLVYDVEGKEYVDYICSWGAIILGHAEEEVVDAIKRQAELGTSYGLATELEVELAEEISRAIPSIEMLRLVNSGTEAVMSAVRLARAYTKRKLVVKFEGCYHGHSDSLLAKAGSGLATHSLPSSAGVPESYVKDTITLPYNDARAVDEVFSSKGWEIACVLVEPIAGNMGVVPADREFLATLREVTEKYGALLIFDEVITGFRVSKGGAQKIYDITPDITCLGKIIGGGLPVGAYGGRAEIMRLVSPLGPVYQAGTLAGNPLCMAAGIATLKRLSNGLYAKLDESTNRLAAGLKGEANRLGVKVVINRVVGMLSIFFTDRPEVRCYSDVASCDLERFGKFFRGMLRKGILLPPSQFESLFLTARHEAELVDLTIKAAGEVMEEASFHE